MNLTIGRNSGSNYLNSLTPSRNIGLTTAQFANIDSDKNKKKMLTHNDDNLNSHKRGSSKLRSSEMFKSPSTASPKVEQKMIDSYSKQLENAYAPSAGVKL